MRALGIDPVHDTRRTFRALVAAMSRPGTIQGLPSERGDHAIAATIVDHEVSLHTRDEKLKAALESEGRFVAAEPEHADVVHTGGQPNWEVSDLDWGTLEEPSGGATVIYRVDSLGADAQEDAPAVEITGPGVSGSQSIHIGLLAEELRALSNVHSAYPRGVDAIFTAEDRVAAIPRSVSTEVT